MILVVGATGRLGFEICRQLRGAGAAVAGIVRNGSPRIADLEGLGVDCREGDLKDVDSLNRACAGVEVIVSSATAVVSRRSGDSLETVDRDGQMSLVAAARAAGAQRFVYVSLSPNGRPTYFVRIKRQVEEAVRASGMHWVVLQPTAFIEIWLSEQLGWDLRRGKARIVGTGTRKVSFISMGDVARFTVLAALDLRTTNRNLVLGGPDALSPIEIVELCQKITGRTFHVQHVPVWMLRTMASLVRLFSRELSELMQLGANSAEDGDAIDMASTLREFPMQMTSIRDYVSQARR
jgi:NADH dehydrogenase